MWFVSPPSISLLSLAHHAGSQDFDGGEIGQGVIQGLQFTQALPFARIDWSVVPSSQFPGGESQVADQVLDEKIWAAVVGAFPVCRLFFVFSLEDSSFWSIDKVE